MIRAATAAILAALAGLAPAAAQPRDPVKESICRDAGAETDALRVYCGRGQASDLVTVADPRALPGADAVQAALAEMLKRGEQPRPDIVSAIADGNISRRQLAADKAAREIAATTRKRQEILGLIKRASVPLKGRRDYVNVSYRGAVCGSRLRLIFVLDPGTPFQQIQFSGEAQFGIPTARQQFARQAQVGYWSQLDCALPQFADLGSVDAYRHLLTQHEWEDGRKVWSLDDMLEHLVHTMFVMPYPATVPPPAAANVGTDCMRDRIVRVEVDGQAFHGTRPLPGFDVTGTYLYERTKDPRVVLNADGSGTFARHQRRNEPMCWLLESDDKGNVAVQKGAAGQRHTLIFVFPDPSGNFGAQLDIFYDVREMVILGERFKSF